MKPPGISNTLKRLARRLFPDQVLREQFVQSLSAPAGYPVAVVWIRDRPAVPVFDPLPRPNWLPDYVDLVTFEQRPGRHELHEQGAFFIVSIPHPYLWLSACVPLVTRTPLLTFVRLPEEKRSWRGGR